MSQLRGRTIKSVFWVLTNRVLIQFVNFIVSVFLARKLTPKEFGIIGIIMIFISVSQIIIEGGLSNSLIRTRKPRPIDYSVVFLTNLSMSFLLYAILFIASPFIAAYFNIPSLEILVRVLGVVIIIRSFSIIQFTMMTIDMDFKKQMTIQVPSLLVGGVTGIVLAYMNFGVWSLVIMQLTTAVVLTGQLWIRSAWKPAFLFDKPTFVYHIRHGSNIMGAQLIRTVFDNVFSFIIGKAYSPAQLGFYSRANSLKQIPVETLSKALITVTLPVFAKLQDDIEKLKRAYLKITQQVFFLITPLLVAMMVLAKPIFIFLFTAKWLPAVPFFQVLCLGGIMQPASQFSGNILSVKEKSGMLFKLELVKRLLLVVLLVIFYRKGVLVLAAIQSFYFLYNFFLQAYFCGREIHASVWQQVKPMLPILGAALLEGLLIWVLERYLPVWPNIVKIILEGGAGLLLYFGLLAMVRFEASKELIGVGKGYLAEFKKKI